MSEPVITFKDIIAPITPEQFFDEYFDKKPLYIPGNAEKYKSVCSWPQVNDMFQMVNNWSDQNLKIVIDTQTVQPNTFCEKTTSRDGVTTMRPQPEKVAALFQQGATIVLDAMETMNSGIRTATEALQMATSFAVSCNAYCSRQQHKAFATHFDWMDVFALHIEGTKTWRVYTGRFENPAGRPGFDSGSFPPEYHQKAKGDLLMEIEMKPGDFLYLPKGVYHDALASTEACLHLSFGLSQPNGLDFFQWLLGSLETFPLVRESMPAYNDTAALEAHIKKLTEGVSEFFSEPTLVAKYAERQRENTFKGVANINMPHPTPLQRFRVMSLGVKLLRRGPDWRLKTSSADVAIAKDLQPVVNWVLDRDHFDTTAMVETFADIPAEKIEELINLLYESDAIDPFY